MDHDLLLLCATIGAGLATRFLYLVFTRSWTTSSKRRSFAVGFSITTISLTLIAIALETVLHYTYVQSDFFGFTYAARRWWDTYWAPVNEFGYRDLAFPITHPRDEHRIIVLGDSIVAGQGINSIKDRFSNILEEKLGSQWRVVNIAKCGWSTREELTALKEHFDQIQPEIVVLTYYPNDIEGALGDEKLLPRAHLPKPSGLSQALTDHSALFSFVYWRSFRLMHRDLGSQYWNLVEEGAASEKIWGRHSEELSGIAQFVSAHSAKLIVVIMPVLPTMDVATGLVEKVARQFASMGVAVIRLEETLKRFSPEQLIVNSQDTHPSMVVHRVIAEKLAENL